MQGSSGSNQVAVAYPTPGTVSAAVNTTQVFPSVYSASAPSILVIPGDSVYEGKRFIVRASGLLTSTGDAFTAIVKIGGNSVVPADPMKYSNWTNHFTGQTFTFGGEGGAKHFSVDLVCLADSTSGVMTIYTLNDMTASTFTAAAAATGATSVNFGNQPAYNFVCSVTFGTGATTNVASLYEFAMLF
jgi:hypothetical protein